MAKQPQIREEAISLRSLGYTGKQIAEQLHTSRSNIQAYTINNPETGEPFKSRSQYQAHLAKQKVNPETGKPFESYSQYNDYLARQRVNPETGVPFESHLQYDDYKTRQRVNPETGVPFKSRSQYQAHLAKQKRTIISRVREISYINSGFKSPSEYMEIMRYAKRKGIEVQEALQFLAEQQEFTNRKDFLEQLPEMDPFSREIATPPKELESLLETEEKYSPMEIRETQTNLKALLGSLSPEQRRIIQERYFKDRTYEEIAKKIGITKQGVQFRERKAIENMQKTAKNNGMDYSFFETKR